MASSRVVKWDIEERSRKSPKLHVIEITSDGMKNTLHLRMRDLIRRINAAIDDEEEERRLIPRTSSKSNFMGEVSPTGTITSTKAHHRHRNLHARDLRSMDPAFSQKAQHPAIVVRRHVILTNFDPLRVVIVHDRMLVLVPPQRQAPEFVDDLRSQLRIASAIAHVDSEDSLAAKVVTSFRSQYSELMEDDDLEGGTNSPLRRDMDDDIDFDDDDFDGGCDTDEDTTTSSILMMPPQQDKKNPPDKKNGGDMSNSPSTKETEQLLPFELRALEAVLAVATRRLAAAVDEVTPLANAASDAFRATRMSLEHLERLRTLKNRVSVLEARARDTAEALNMVLEEDEDMCMMRLSKLRSQPHLFEPPLSPAMLTQHEDVELLLENYLQHTTAVQTALELLRLSIENAESSFAMKLDISRNRLIAVDTIFALFSAVLAIAAVIGGFWGMNLDQHRSSFLLVTTTTAAVCLALITIIFFFLFRSNILFF